MESLEQFFKDNQRGYPRDPRRMAYAKLQKNTQGMDREQLDAFITANLFIPHSQYKMALGNLIQFLKKQNQMRKLNEVKQFQKIAGLINENWHPDDPASVDMDDIEDEDPEDFDDVSEDADYESESGDTNAMGGINEYGEDEYEKQLTVANQAVANGSQIANSDMYGKITPSKFVDYFKGEGRDKKFIYYYMEPGEEVGAVPVTIEQAAGLIKSLISNVPVPKGLPAGYAWRLYAI
jgi:hypothetical protein